MLTKENLETLIRMMKERADYWEDRYDHLRKFEPNSFACGDADGCSNAYLTCAHFLELALEGDWECLNQYDYYGKD